MTPSFSSLSREIFSQYTTSDNVPSELWSMTFCYCLPTNVRADADSNSHVGLSTDERLVSLRLASVCSSWRRVAINTPQLWSTCWLSFRHPELNTLWLGRSGSLMLHLYGRDIDEESSWVPLFKSISPFQKRWKTLELDTFVYSRVSGERDKLTLQETGLASLKVGSMHDPEWVLNVVRHSPQLHEMEITAISLLANIIYRSPYAHNLTSLKLAEWLTPASTLVLLSRLPLLQNLEIVLEETSRDPPPGETIVHSNLRRLQIAGDADMADLFDHVNTPSLQTLRLILRFDPQTVMNFIDCSQARITEFAFADGPVEDYYEVLERMRWIERVEFIGETDTISSDLCDLFKDRHKFPHLTQILFPGHEIYDEDEDGIIADLLVSRAQPQICKCEKCLGEQDARRVGLEYALVYGLDKERRVLDIARLVPLPGDRVEDERCARIVIDLVLKGDSEEGELSQKLHCLIGHSAWNRALDSDLGI